MQNTERALRITASSISNDPVLHFLIFVPSAKRSPLRILDASGHPVSSTAFSIPQWGSIYVHNPPPSSSSSLSASALHVPFSVFRTQLLSLLGVPPLPPNIQLSHPHSSSHFSHSEDPISDWSLDAAMRRRAMENARESAETLGSIVRLVRQIEGMPVGKDVTEDVSEALEALDLVCPSLLFSSLLLVRSPISHIFLSGFTLQDIQNCKHIHEPSRRAQALSARTRSFIESLLQSGHARIAVLPSRAQSRSVHSPSRARLCASYSQLAERAERLVEGEKSCSFEPTMTMRYKYSTPQLSKAHIRAPFLMRR